MSIRILALCGSPRKDESRTAWLVQKIATAAAERGAQTEYYDVTRLDIRPCLGCGRCHHLGRCVQKDDYNRVFESMLAADGIVMGSPVYIYQVTAQLKMLIDRFSNAVHCQRLAGKYAAVATTAGGSGHDETAAYMEQLFWRLGAQCVGKIATVLPDGPVALDSAPARLAEELGVRLVEAIAAGEQIPEQVSQVGAMRRYFRDVIARRREDWPWEYRYWQEKGWL